MSTDRTSALSVILYKLVFGCFYLTIRPRARGAPGAMVGETSLPNLVSIGVGSETSLLNLGSIGVGSETCLPNLGSIGARP